MRPSSSVQQQRRAAPAAHAPAAAFKCVRAHSGQRARSRRVGGGRNAFPTSPPQLQHSAQAFDLQQRAVACAVARYDNVGPLGGQAGELPKPQAWQVVCGVVALAMLFCSLHRSVFTLAAPLLGQELQLSVGQVGVVHSSMLWGYLVGQVPAGWLSDHWGGEKVLVLCLLLWSASLAATACANSLPAVLFSRACFGLASACAMPAVSSMASAWVPAAIKASVIAFIYFCFNMGGVLGWLVTGPAMSQLGWRSTIILAAVAGVAWSAAGSAVLQALPTISKGHPAPPALSSSSSGHYSSSLGARSASRAQQQQQQSKQSSRAGQGGASGSFWDTVRVSQVMVLCWAHAVIGFGFFVFQSWIPMYLQSLGATGTATGTLACAPWLAAGIVGAITGGLADSFIRQGAERLLVRRAMHGVSTLGCAAAMMPLALGQGVGPVEATLCLMVFNACYAFSFGGFHAYIQDATAGTSVAGRLTGWTNSAGTLLGILGNVLTGLLVQATGSFQVVFVVTGALYVSSMLAFTVVLDGRSVHKELQHT